MTLGGWKYDSECTLARERTNAEAKIVIVVNGQPGTGFSCQTISLEIINGLPSHLRNVAQESEKHV
jgi:hypothetical protein